MSKIFGYEYRISSEAAASVQAAGIIAAAVPRAVSARYNNDFIYFNYLGSQAHLRFEG